VKGVKEDANEGRGKLVRRMERAKECWPKAASLTVLYEKKKDKRELMSITRKAEEVSEALGREKIPSIEECHVRSKYMSQNKGRGASPERHKRQRCIV
jgi:hypothetical protein